MDALLHERYRFESEAWIGPEKSSIREWLLRAWDEEGQPISNEKAFKAVVEEGLTPLVNNFLIHAALQKIKPDNESFLTLNASCTTLAKEEFWQKLEQLTNIHKPEKVIFEILEYDTHEKINEDLLKKACEKGYRFALDDFSLDRESWQRLEDYAPYVDYIKFDGPLVRAGLDGDPKFFRTIEYLKENYPDIELIAERVQNKEEAAFLFEHGISFVQGRDLVAPGDKPKPQLPS